MTIAGAAELLASVPNHPISFARRSTHLKSLGIVGLSQGGHIAPLVANLCDEIAYVVDVSGSATTPVQQVDIYFGNRALWSVRVKVDGEDATAAPPSSYATRSKGSRAGTP